MKQPLSDPSTLGTELHWGGILMFDEGSDGWRPVPRNGDAERGPQVFHPRLVVEPWCTLDGIPQPALKQQGSKLRGLRADPAQ